MRLTITDILDEMLFNTGKIKYINYSILEFTNEINVNSGLCKKRRNIKHLYVCANIEFDGRNVHFQQFCVLIVLLILERI